MLRSIIRIGFHERRLQYMEKDLIMQWKQCRQSERILEIDVPLSYGIYQNLYNSQDINKCEFIWDPTKEAGVFVKVSDFRKFENSFLTSIRTLFTYLLSG